jgi:hypothetical protein
MTRWLLLLVIALLPGVAAAQPAVDHHQHLFSPALAELIKGTPISAASRLSSGATTSRNWIATGRRCFRAAAKSRRAAG